MPRRLAALGAALLLALAAGCGIVTSPSDDDGSPGGGGGGGRDTPRVDLAGLPIGGDTTLVGDVWCGEAFHDPPPADGVAATITDVTAVDAVVVDADCPGSSACDGSTLDADNRACTVAVRPDSGNAQTVTVVLAGYATCDADQVCADYRAAADGATWTMSAPDGWPIDPAPPSPEGLPSEESGSS